jgi:hypothetical protein
MSAERHKQTLEDAGCHSAVLAPELFVGFKNRRRGQVEAATALERRE